MHGAKLYKQVFGHVIWHVIVVNINRSIDQSEDRKDKLYVII